MKSPKPGDVLLAELPVQVPTGFEQQGKRPVIVVGLPETLGKSRFPMLVVVPLTTASGSWRAAAPKLYPKLAKGAGGLARDSTVLLEQIRGLDARRVSGYLGRLTASEYALVKEGLRTMLAFG